MWERLRNRNQEVCVLKLDDQKWHRKSQPEVVPEDMTGSGIITITGSGTRSHDQKWYRKSWPEVVPEVLTRSGTRSHGRKWYRKSWLEVMTGSGTGSHDRKWYLKSWPEVALEVITGSGIEILNLWTNEIWAWWMYSKSTDRQTDQCWHHFKHLICSKDAVLYISSSRNCFDTGGIQNPVVRTRKWTRRVHSPNYWLKLYYL